MAEVKLMKGNEVLAEAAIRCGCDAYYGYPCLLYTSPSPRDA